MNVLGSYKKLLNNSKSALFASVEIYNKPKFDYREEVFIILLVNAWELLHLAILSKNKQRIFQKKQRKSDYQTLKFDEAFKQCKNFLPDNIKKNIEVISLNLKYLRKYRNDIIHYYGNKATKYGIYALSQTAIINYVDLAREVFNEEISQEINIILLPLSFNKPPDIVKFLSKQKNTTPFVVELISVLNRLKNKNIDTGKFVTTLSISLEKNNKIQSSDFTGKYTKESNTVAVQKINPDDTYPFFRNDIIESKKNNKHKKMHKNITSYQFQAITYQYKIKDNERYCWASKKGGSPRYSQDIINFLNDLTDEQIDKATIEYKLYIKNRRLKIK
jgi:hypothetical protein